MECMKTAICKDCTENLHQYGELCFDACILACMGMTEGEMAKFNPERNDSANTTIKFLEQKEYLISSEITQKEIGFIPTCEPSLTEDNTLVYCWCK